AVHLLSLRHRAVVRTLPLRPGDCADQGVVRAGPRVAVGLGARVSRVPGRGPRAAPGLARRGRAVMSPWLLGRLQVGRAPCRAAAIFALAWGAGSTTLGRIAARMLATPSDALAPGHVLAFAAVFVVTLAETGRLPVDNPATHLELTMIHEAMLLEYSGRYLALIEWAAALKLLVFFT